MCSIQHFLQSSSSCVIDVTHKLGTLINNQNFIHMTKHLRYLFAVLLVWVCTVGGYAQTTIVFQESFSKCSSTGGNDGNWATTVGGNEVTNSSTFDNSGWTSLSKIYQAKQCVKLASGGFGGTMTTPSIKYETGCSYSLSFKAGGLKGKTPTLTLSISNGTLSKTSFSIGAEAFGDYSADITATSDFTITFSVPKKQQSLLDEIVITKTSSSSSLTSTTTTFGTDKDGSIVALTEGLLSDGSDFTGYTATESTGVAGTISYAASGDGVATIDAVTGALTVNKTTYGTTTITATFTPTDTETYATSTAKYTITNEKKVDESTIVFSSDDNSFAEISGLSGSGYKSGNVDFVASNGKSYTFTCNRVMLSNDRLQINKSTVTSPNFTNFTSGYSLTITYASNSGSLTLSSGSSEVTGASTGNGTTYKSVTLNVSDGGSFVIQETKGNALYIKSIELTALTPKTAPALSFANPTEEVELKEGLVDIQTITKPADFDGTITYVSSDNTTAEVTEGMITLKKTGEVTIKATSAATDNYAAGSAEYTLKVVDTRADAQISVKEESVDAELSVGMYDPADNVNNPNNVKLTYASSNADITINEADYLAFSKVGSTTVTVSFAGDNSYKPFETSFTLNIVDTRTTEAPISIKEQTVTVKLPTEEYEASTNVTNDQELTLTYAIDNKDFEIDETTGYVVFNKVGSTTVTVSFAGDKTYKPFTGTFTLNVEESRTTDESFKFDKESYTLDLADGKAEFDANAKLQNPHNLTYTWAINPMTNGESIDASGKATGLKRGTYTITATSQTDNNYLATTATCTLVVKNSAVEELQVKLVSSADKGTTSSSSATLSKGYVTISSKGAAFGNGTDYRFYANKAHTISTKVGTIIKIEFKGSDTSNPVSNLTYNGTDGEYKSEQTYSTWTGSATSVTFTTGTKKQARATEIIVTLELPVAKNYTLDEATTDNVIESYENANVTLKRTLEASHWNTFCVPFALDADEVKQYFGEGTELRTYEGNCDGSTVNFATVDNIEAGKPYIMKPGTAVVTNPEFKNVSMVADDLDANGNPQAVGATTSVQMKGIYNHVTLEQNETNLYIGAGNKFYYPADAEACEMNGLRAYFIVPEGTDIKKLRANLDGTATSLDAIFGTEETNAAVYNLQGLYVGNSLKQLKSGVYIQNGKKIVVK